MKCIKKEILNFNNRIIAVISIIILRYNYICNHSPDICEPVSDTAVA